MEQLALMDTNQFAVHAPKPQSRLDEAIARGMSIVDYLARESRLNDKFYGISYKERMELSMIGHKFEWLFTERFERKDLPERPTGLKQAYADFLGRDLPERMPKIEKPYKPQPLETKQRTRCGRLMARANKSFSLLELRQEWLYQQVERNPDYYGVCLLTEKP
jgi:hypothetical protein